MKKSIIAFISIVLITIIIVILITINHDNKKTKKYDKNIDTALNIITFKNNVVEKKDLKFVKINNDGRYIFKVKNKKEYYYVDLIDRSFEYSEY